MIINIPPIQSDFDGYRNVNFGSGEEAIYRLWWFMVLYLYTKLVVSTIIQLPRQAGLTEYC